MLSLADLPRAFAAARAEAEALARPVASGLCRYCGGRWTPAAIGKLSGHAACIVTPEFLAAIRSATTLTREQLAELLGVPFSTVRAWTRPRTIESGPRWSLPVHAISPGPSEPTPEGLRALQPQPMTLEEIADLVDRTREADRMAAAESAVAAARAHRRRRRLGSLDRFTQARREREREHAREHAKAYARTLRSDQLTYAEHELGRGAA